MRSGLSTGQPRDDEPGIPLASRGTVTNLDGTPIEGALVALWHADAAGLFRVRPGHPGVEPGDAIRTAPDGRFTFHTIQPAPLPDPPDGSCGALIAAAGWHPWRRAHLHLKVSAPGRKPVTSQLYFEGGEYIDSDVAQAVKPELIPRPTPATSGVGNEVTYHFALDPA